MGKLLFCCRDLALDMPGAALLVLVCLVAQVACQLITNDQEIAMMPQYWAHILFDEKVVHEDECQCGKPLRSSGEWITTCRLCADVALMSTLYITVAASKHVVASWRTSNAQSCVIDAYGRTQFSAMSCHKTLHRNLVYATFRLRPTDQNFKYDEVPWMCGAEAMASNFHKALFSNWGDGNICYKDQIDDNYSTEKQSLNTATFSSSVGATNFITRRSVNITTSFTHINTYSDLPTTTQVEKRTLISSSLTYTLLIIIAVVFALLFLIGIIVVVSFNQSLKRRRKKKLSQEPSQRDIVLHDEIPEIAGYSTYETPANAHSDRELYASLATEHLIEDRQSINMLNAAVDEQENINNSQDYQHLSSTHYGQSHYYDRIPPHSADYASILP